ncbi:MAG: LegC family aminotransferase [Candidatus Omnitrophica bacterium]|nr:LegC family aminotransferase [Candidatus Omnitrophota bacterium]
MGIGLAPTPSEAGRTPIPLSAPLFSGREWDYLKECLETHWVSSAGPFVDRFEKEIARLTGARHAVAVTNGTAALHTALKVSGVEPQDEVLVPDLTFIAPVNAVRYCQAHPVLLDVDAHWQMDVEKLERFLREECRIRSGECFNRKTGRRVRAVLPVHLLGLACSMDRIVSLAQAHHLKVVEDAAEALGVRFRGNPVGTFGSVGALSFNGNKIVTAGGGGMVITNDAEVAKRARYLTTQARDDPMEYVHEEVGYNYRLTNLQAALGVAQLEQLDRFLEAKRRIAKAYGEALRGTPEVLPMAASPHTEPSFWLYTVRLPEGTPLARRQAVVRFLHERGVEARPVWRPIHLQRPYRDCQTFELKESLSLYHRSICMPSSVGLEPEALNRCVTVLQEGLRAFK